MAKSKPLSGHQAHMQKADNLGIIAQVDRPIKVVFLGAGSWFLEQLGKDVLRIPGAEEGEFCLVDIDRSRLELARKLMEFLKAKLHRPGWKITPTTDLRKVLSGAQYVINCIEVSGVNNVRFDYEIPARYGVDQCIGDTIGPGGLFKALRTAPTWRAILADVEKYCPDAWVLNYTNPMSILCLVAHRTSQANVIGLCHSVQGSSSDLAGWARVPYEQMQWRCAGVNHCAWFTELKHNGQDLYPALKERFASDPEFRRRESIRGDLMMHLGYFPSESSPHHSEYSPFYRKRLDLLGKFGLREGFGGSGDYSRHWPKRRGEVDAWRRGLLDGTNTPKQLGRSVEYASYILQAMETNSPFVIYSTVPNNRLIENLPQDGMVEVACLVDRRGVTPTHFGKLPPQCAAVSDWHMRMYDLAAQACIEKSKDVAVHALMLDPLTAAVCCPAEIRKMTMELFEAEKAYLPGYK